jgi:uncharacterized protein
MVRIFREDGPARVSVTLLDGIVFARSAIHHSMNHQSVIVRGVPEVLEAQDQKLAALEAFVERVAPTRWGEIRTPSEDELRATAVVPLSLDQLSVKMRSGPLVEDESDLNRRCAPKMTRICPKVYPLQNT